VSAPFVQGSGKDGAHDVSTSVPAKRDQTVATQLKTRMLAEGKLWDYLEKPAKEMSLSHQAKWKERENFYNTLGICSPAVNKLRTEGMARVQIARNLNLMLFEKRSARVLRRFQELSAALVRHYNQPEAEAAALKGSAGAAASFLQLPGSLSFSTGSGEPVAVQRWAQEPQGDREPAGDGQQGGQQQGGEDGRVRGQGASPSEVGVEGHCIHIAATIGDDAEELQRHSRQVFLFLSPRDKDGLLPSKRNTVCVLAFSHPSTHPTLPPGRGPLMPCACEYVCQAYSQV